MVYNSLYIHDTCNHVYIIILNHSILYDVRMIAATAASAVKLPAVSSPQAPRGDPKHRRSHRGCDRCLPANGERRCLKNHVG